MATSSPTSQSSVTLKLLIDSKGNRVFFAEAGKDFADFLFTLLSLPVGTVIRLLSAIGMVGTLGKLYKCFESLNDTYIQPNVNKDILLNPSSSLGFSSSSILLSLTDSRTSVRKRLYVCGSCFSRGSDERPGARCSNCNNLSTILTELVYVPPPAPQVGGSSFDGGFVKGVVTYMIMDDLEVKPMSTISSIAMLKQTLIAFSTIAAEFKHVLRHPTMEYGCRILSLGCEF